MLSGGFSGGGQFDLTGHAHCTVPRPRQTSLTVDLQLDFSNHLSGVISGGTWTAALAMNRAVFNAVNNKAGKLPASARWPSPATMCGILSPGGAGCATVSVNTAGAIKMTGTLADGTVLTPTAAISGDGQWPLYVVLTGGGSLFGWIDFTNQPATTLGGMLSWIRPAGPVPKSYTAGFTNLTSAIGSRYTVTKYVPVLALTNGQGHPRRPSLGFTSSTNAVSINNNNAHHQRLPPGQDALSLTLTSSTGLISGTYKFPGTGAVTPVHGVILQEQAQAQGYWAQQQPKQHIPWSFPLNENQSRPFSSACLWSGWLALCPFPPKTSLSTPFGGRQQFSRWHQYHRPFSQPHRRGSGQCG